MLGLCPKLEDKIEEKNTISMLDSSFNLFNEKKILNDNQCSKTEIERILSTIPAEIEIKPPSDSEDPIGLVLYH